MKAAPRMFTYVRKSYKIAWVVIGLMLFYFAFSGLKSSFYSPDFGKTFGPKSIDANTKLQEMDTYFSLCAQLCRQDPEFMQSLVFPEVMRYNSLKDGIEAESLRTLYVQLGQDYADFSIGIFQMKPSFAAMVEAKAMQHLPDSILAELQLAYAPGNAMSIRQQRVERLQDEHWQLIYLTAFICICNKIFADQEFDSPEEKLQWYATVYNAGFDKPATYIQQKIKQDNFYLSEDMPGKKFKYAAIVRWHYRQKLKGTQPGQGWHALALSK